MTPRESRDRRLTDHSVLSEAARRVVDTALQVLARNPGGLWRSSLCEQVAAELPDYAPSTVYSLVVRLPDTTSGRVERPRRGLYRLRTDGGGSEHGMPSRSSSLPASNLPGPPKPHGRSGVVNRIRAAALDVLKSSPGVMRFSEIKLRLANRVPDASSDIVGRAITDLPRRFPAEIERPDPGLYRYRSNPASTDEALPAAKIQKTKASENDFYASFAGWLKNETEECSIAVPLGGNKFHDKWGTPDVIGRWESPHSHIVKAPTEIVSAEIKTDSTRLIEAFGQACAYKIFSHKSYLVVPKTANQDDKSRLDALCQIFGIGLVLFDSTNKDDPGFEIRVRPVRHEPDMFYVNKYVKEVERELFP